MNTWFFANGNQGNVTVTTCSATQLSKMAVARIEQLRVLRDGSALPDLYGFVGTHPLRSDPAGWELVQPIPDLTVTVRSDSAEYRTQTSDDGMYRFQRSAPRPVSVERCGTSWTPGALGGERGTPECEPGHSLCDELRSLLGWAHHWHGSSTRWSTAIRNGYSPVRWSGTRRFFWSPGESWPLRDPEVAARPLPAHVYSDRCRPTCGRAGVLPGHTST